MSNYFRVKLEEIVPLTKEAKLFRFKSEETVNFKPGQWMDFKVDPEELVKIFTESDFQILEKRGGVYPVGGFSFTSLPNQNLFEFISKGWEKSNHPVTRYMHTKAQPGQVFLATHGFGHMYLEPTEVEDKPLVFIAGGIGITPFISIFRTCNLDKNRVKLIISTRSTDLIPCLEELKELVPDITINLTDGSPEKRLSKEKLAITPDSRAFICGPYQMTKDMVKACQELGVPEENIKAEFWTK